MRIKSNNPAARAARESAMSAPSKLESGLVAAAWMTPSANAPALRTSGTTKRRASADATPSMSEPERAAERALYARRNRKADKQDTRAGEAPSKAYPSPSRLPPLRGRAFGRIDRVRRRARNDGALESGHCRVRGGCGAKSLGRPSEPSCPPRIFDRSSSATTDASAPSRMICGLMKRISSVRVADLLFDEAALPNNGIWSRMGMPEWATF